MKEDIIKILNELIQEIKQKLPKRQPVRKQEIISDVCGVDLADFMRDNSIPNSAFITINGTHPILSWIEYIEPTEEYIENYITNRFDLNCLKRVVSVFEEHGYKRKRYRSRDVKTFEKLSRYDLFIDGQYDLLIGLFKIWFEYEK